MQSETNGRSRKGFALGNLAAGFMLGVGLYALPVRVFVADAIVVAAVLAIAGGSAVALARPPLAWVGLRIAALTLLGIGLLIIAAAALSLAYLSGVHGDYGRGGALIMTLVLFLMVPYTLVYPVLELLWLHARRSKPAADQGA